MGKAASRKQFGKGSNMNPTRDKIRLDVEKLPELETEVAISGSCKQQEVGGIFCLGLAAGIAIYVSR
jgi:hypothetical protein